MKFTSIFAGALATLAAAAPAQKEIEERNAGFGRFNQFDTGLKHGVNFDVVGLGNNFAFNNLHVAYIAALNGFQANHLSHLVVNQNLDFGHFENIFGLGANLQYLELDHILSLHSACVLSWLSSAGLLNQVDFRGGAIPRVDFGNLGNHISNRSRFNLGLDQVVTTQITTFVQDTGLFSGGRGFKE